MTLRPKSVPCLNCGKYPVNVYHPICPPCSHTLSYPTIQSILHDRHQYTINIPRIPSDDDFITMANYLQTTNEVSLSGPTAASMTVNLTPAQTDRCTIEDAITAIWNLHITGLVEVAARINIKSPSSTLLTLRRVLPGESETSH